MKRSRLERKTELRNTTPLERTGSLSRSTPLAAGRAKPKPECAADGCDRPRRTREWCGLHYSRLMRHGDVTKVDRRGRGLDEEARFALTVMPGLPSDHRPDLGPCLLFTGADNGNGYGQFRHNGRNGYAHRYAWERVNGPIPAELTVDHLCRVRCCVEITHLELVDGPTNTRRGAAAQVMCRNGLHERTAENTMSRRDGRKQCIPCVREQSRRSQAKRRKPAGAPDERIRYDQRVVREQIALVRAAESTIAQAARVIGCNPNYLGRRVWQETRADVLARDGGVCIRCGAAEAQEVHHRRSRGHGGSADPETSFGMANLASLCSPCHQHITGEPAEGYDNGWMLRRSWDTSTTPFLHASQGLVLLGNDGSVTPYNREAA